MRIRKRKVPLPLSLLSPVPLTDPHLFSRSPVEADHNLSTPTCSSDHVPTPTCCSASDLHPLPDCNHNNTTNVSLVMTGVQISNDNSSNASITTSCAPADDDINNNTGPLLLSNNNEGLGRWCDGDGVIPLKKRRTKIMKRDVENEEEEKQMKSSVLSSDTINGDNSNSNSQVSAKKSNSSKKGSTIMEGSRCSRVNGRGWRCCQQTLVGYSLCEHHLGKGRLRSMTSSSTTTTLKSSSFKKKNASNNTTCSLNTTSTSFVVGNHFGQQEETFANNNTNNNNNKRMKLGVVKARSLSSLLGQTII